MKLDLMAEKLHWITKKLQWSAHKVATKCLYV